MRGGWEAKNTLSLEHVKSNIGVKASGLPTGMVFTAGVVHRIVSCGPPQYAQLSGSWFALSAEGSCKVTPSVSYDFVESYRLWCLISSPPPFVRTTWLLPCSCSSSIEMVLQLEWTGDACWLLTGGGLEAGACKEGGERPLGENSSTLPIEFGDSASLALRQCFTREGGV